jgi:hypothetical protein
LEVKAPISSETSTLTHPTAHIPEDLNPQFQADDLSEKVFNGIRFDKFKTRYPGITPCHNTDVHRYSKTAGATSKFLAPEG